MGVGVQLARWRSSTCGWRPCFAAWMWVRSPRPRRVTTLLVTAGFLVFAGYSVRNIVFIGPVLALQVAWTAPNRSPPRCGCPLRSSVRRRPWRRSSPRSSARARRSDARLPGRRLRDCASSQARADRHLRRGRLLHQLALAETPVVMNGWLEHYTPQQLRDNYGVLRAGTAGPPRALRRIHAGAVIAHVPSAIRRLEAAGFRPVFSSSQGTYLVQVAKGRERPRKLTRG